MIPPKIIPAFMIATALTIGATTPETHVVNFLLRLAGNLFWVLWLIWPDKKDDDQ